MVIKQSRRPSSGMGGFTLVELMMGVLLLAILMGVGLPSFQSFITDQRLRATSSDLRTAIMTSRSEAVKRNKLVELQPSGGGWSDGWTIPSPNAGDPAIFNHVQSGNVTITGPTEAEFTPSGRALAAADFEMEAGTAANSSKRCLQLQVDGRTNTIEGECP